MKKLSLLAVAAVALSLAGCGFSEKSLVGTWSGKINLSEADRKEAGAQASAAEAMTTSLEFKEDKTFSLTMGVPIEGTWTYADKNVTLTTTKVMGMDISSIPGADKDNKPQILKVEDGGKKLVLSDPSGASGTTITFTKNDK
jgi:hypothetical protein